MTKQDAITAIGDGSITSDQLKAIAVAGLDAWISLANRGDADLNPGERAFATTMRGTFGPGVTASGG